MAVLENLVDRICRQSITCCVMADIRILRKGVATKTKYKSKNGKRYYSQISLLKLNTVSLFHEIQVIYALRYPGVSHLLTQQSFPGNWNTQPGNSD
jgi:hypothetical protein